MILPPPSISSPAFQRRKPFPSSGSLYFGDANTTQANTTSQAPPNVTAQAAKNSSFPSATPTLNVSSSDTVEKKQPAPPHSDKAPNASAPGPTDANAKKTPADAADSESKETIKPREESPADRLSLPTKELQKELLSDDDRKLQRRYPGRNATLTMPLPFNQTGSNALGALKALGLWARGLPAQDYQLSSLSTTTTMAGSAMIAILTTLGMRGPKKANGAIEFVPEFLGVVSWFTAMALTPKFIDTFVRMKTGLDLDQNYDSSYGERKKLYTDPHYLPMYLLSDKTINRVAKRLGIPEDAPDRHDQIEDRIRQVSVQAHTWWMLVAGPAAAVLSGLTCDILQSPVLNAANALRKKLSSTKEAELGCFIAPRPESDLSQWWKKLGAGIIKHAKLNDKNPHYEIRAQNTIAQLAALSKPENKKRLADLKKFVNAQDLWLKKIDQHVQDLLKNTKGRIVMTEYEKMDRFANERLSNARSTQSHYHAVIKLLEDAKSPDAELKSQLRQRMESNLPVLQGFLDHDWSTATELAGGEKNLLYIIKSLQEKQPGKAANAMGAAPMEHIMESLLSHSMRQRWQMRMSKGVGGAIALSTLLYVTMFVGRNFKPLNSDGAEADPTLEEAS